jgi:hypothetical protein
MTALPPHIDAALRLIGWISAAPIPATVPPAPVRVVLDETGEPEF